MNIQELNMRTWEVKLRFELDKAFLYKSPKAWSIKEQIAKSLSIKIKSYALQNCWENKKKIHTGRKYLQTICLIKDLDSEYIKNSQASIGT